VDTHSASAELVPTPSRRMLCIDFDGPPDMERLAKFAADSGDAFVRVRWQVDEEHRQSVDRAAIEAMFAHAPGVKIEPRILPVVRSRAEGISLETSVDAKLARWCELTDVQASPLLERLQLLESGDANAIAQSILDGLDGAPAEATRSVALTLVDSKEAVAADAAATVPASTGQSLDWLEGDLFAA
jgi:DNA repair protein SbcD/Mre11